MHLERNAECINKMKTELFDLVMYPPMVSPSHTHTISTSGINQCPPTCGSYPSDMDKWGNLPKEDKKPMASYASATVVSAENIELSQRSAVRDALRAAGEKIKSAMKREFGLVDDDAPKSPADLIKRIQDGQYTVDEGYVDHESWGAEGAVRYIRWRDPKVVEDKAGYKVARAEFDEAYESYRLKSLLVPVEELLALVEDFKAWKHA